MTTARDVLTMDPQVGKLDFGVSHGDDLLLMLGHRKESSKADDDMMQKMTKMWKTFAASRTAPDPNWKPVDPESSSQLYAILDLESLRMEREENFEARASLVSSLLSVRSKYTLKSEYLKCDVKSGAY